MPPPTAHQSPSLQCAEAQVDSHHQTTSRTVIVHPNAPGNSWHGTPLPPSILQHYPECTAAQQLAPRPPLHPHITWTALLRHRPEPPPHAQAHCSGAGRARITPPPQHTHLNHSEGAGSSAFFSGSWARWPLPPPHNRHNHSEGAGSSGFFSGSSPGSLSGSVSGSFFFFSSSSSSSGT